MNVSEYVGPIRLNWNEGNLNASFQRVFSLKALTVYKEDVSPSRNWCTFTAFLDFNQLLCADQ